MHSRAIRSFLLVGNPSGVLCNIGFPSETPLQLKLREISFVHNICLSYQFALKFCTEQSNDTAVLCTKFQNRTYKFPPDLQSNLSELISGETQRKNISACKMGRDKFCNQKHNSLKCE